MSKLVINNLPEDKALDRAALAEFSGGFSPSQWLTQVGMQQIEDAKAASNYSGEPELGDISSKFSSLGLFQNQPFTPHS